MRFFTFSMVSAMFVGLAACNGGGAEDCSDNADNDGDAAVDCDDSECATDAACDDTNDTTDTTDTNDGPEVCDDEAGDDEDGDGDANCADSDCAGISTNCDEIMGIFEIGHATITATTWTGTGTQGFEVYGMDATSFTAPTKTLCEVEFDQAGVEHASAADCTDCDFAFEVSFDNTAAQSGTDCTNFDLTTDTGPYSVDGNSYGYGFNPVYEYDSQTFPVLMYFYDGTWGFGSADAISAGDQFDYSFALGQGLYYY